MKITKKRMQQALDGLASAHNRALKWRDVVTKYSEQEFGVDPSDVHCEDFIDSCDGGMGYCEGMTVAEFRAAMTESIDRDMRSDGS